MSLAEVRSWMHEPDPRTFPYDAVVRDYHGDGKHFVRPELLALLDEVRGMLPSMHGQWPHLRTLAAFLATALDKPDGAYDYPSYLALPLLQLPHVDDAPEQAPFALARCDRLLVQLVADAMAFELAALGGRTTLLPRLRPDAELVAKRLKHGLRAIRPALARMSLDHRLTATSTEDLARQVCSVVDADMSLAERRTARLTILPVYTAHDEYLFLRVLQSFETTFALLAVQLRAAVTALGDGDVARAVFFLDRSAGALEASTPLFSMLATMQVESFRTFREFTDGASAIQSRNYKLVESLCRPPDGERVDSAAFTSVPPVRARVLAGQDTLEEAREAAIARGLTPDDRRRLDASMAAFAGVLTRWRNTHYRVAVRMLGTATGTGSTAGTPYLDAVRSIPVFRSVDPEDRTHEAGHAGRRSTARQIDQTPQQTAQQTRGRTGCPAGATTDEVRTSCP